MTRKQRKLRQTQTDKRHTHITLYILSQHIGRGGVHLRHVAIQLHNKFIIYATSLTLAIAFLSHFHTHQQHHCLWSVQRSSIALHNTKRATTPLFSLFSYLTNLKIIFVIKSVIMVKWFECSQIFVYLAGGQVFECLFLVFEWILKST